MLPDYYRILGVPSSASIDMIKKAYRTCALKYHPDRGGTHERMAMINEAWEILSNPALRSRYDLARHASATTAMMAAAADDSQNARRRADDYPRKWVDFQKWMDSILNDFTSAEYNSTAGGWPTAHKTFSGWIFIIIGGIAGLIVGALLAVVVGIKDASGFGRMWCMAFAMGGAWAGRVIHGLIGSALKGSPSEEFNKPKDQYSEPFAEPYSPGQPKPSGRVLAEWCGWDNTAYPAGSKKTNDTQPIAKGPSVTPDMSDERWEDQDDFPKVEDVERPTWILYVVLVVIITVILSEIFLQR